MGYTERIRAGVWLGLLLLITVCTVLPEDAAAVPAFARRHKLSCTTCHTPFPRLKDYGEEFAGNGFILPEGEEDRDYVNTGDDLLRLNRDFHIGARFDAYMVYDQDLPVETDLQIPWGIKLLSGGAVTRTVGYYFYFYMSERGEVAGIEDAYLHFNDLGGSALDIMLGQFQTSDPLMKRELRLTFEDYLIYKTRIGNSNNNLAYDRGVMVTYGIESTHTDLVAMLVNGNGKDEAGDDHKFDSDKYKNYGARISQGLGDLFRVGYYYYAGEEGGSPLIPDGDPVPDPMPIRKNDITYHGPDFSAGNGMFDLTCQYLIRTDTNPQFVGGPTEIETTGIVAELVISPQRDQSRHYFTLLYNQIDSDLDGHDYETFTGGVTYLMARNLRLNLEFTRDLEGERNRGVLGVVSGF